MMTPEATVNIVPYSGELESYLVSMAALTKRIGTMCNMEGFVLEHGRGFVPRPLPSEYQHRKGIIRQCFKNAAVAANSDPSLIYVEGFASVIIPMLHAWCITKDTGEVVELTWENGDAKAYWGIPFNTRFLRRQLLKNKTYGLIDQWTGEFALLRGVYPKAEWLHPQSKAE